MTENETTRRVRLLTSFGGEEVRGQFGDIVDVAEATAKRMVAARNAVFVEDRAVAASTASLEQKSRGSRFERAETRVSR